MKKFISILGSTGSIGTQALKVIQRLGYTVSALSAFRNIDLLEKQVRAFRPALVSVYDETAARELRERLKRFKDVTVLSGKEGNLAVATEPTADMVLTSMVGMIGLEPTIAAIRAGKDIALANKETLVCAGQLIMDLARKKGVNIYPVDSEHSAIFQCLQGKRNNTVKKIWLTASGGPFRGFTRDQLRHVTKEQALHHPNWSMGAKITIDSATMMNKGLEIIEARWLFDVPQKDINVAVHPESIVHSMVQFEDNAILAQLGVPSMEIPIQYALTYPDRVETEDALLLDPFEKSLHFERADDTTFPLMSVCRKALDMSGLMPAVANGANEAAVELFLNDVIDFYQINEAVESSFAAFSANKQTYTIKDVIEADQTARFHVYAKYL